MFTKDEANMGRSSIFLFKDRVFWTLVLALLVSYTFQGVDLLDEGFHATFYQQFYDDPSSVSYAFFYWLTGLIGGTFLKIFPAAGLWHLRLLGALTIWATMYACYRMLRAYVARDLIYLSFLLLALYLNNDPKDLYYNNLSALIYFLAALALYQGFRKDSLALMALSGALAGINIFTRTPNVLGLGLPGCLLLLMVFERSERSRFIKRTASFFAGALVGIGSVLLIMRSLGHLGYYGDSLKSLVNLGSSAKTDKSLNGSYGASGMTVTYVLQLVKALVSAAALMIAVLGITAAVKQANAWRKWAGALVLIACTVVLAPFIWSFIRDGIVNYKYTNLLVGTCMIFCVRAFLTGKEAAYRLLALVALFIIVVHPFGSAVGIFTVVPYSLWLGVPIAFHEIGLLAGRGLGAEPLRIRISASDLVPAKYALVAIFMLCSVYNIARNPYFYDFHDRWHMTASVHSPYMKGIRTSPERARVLNELLEESNKWIKPNDHVLAYDMIPLYHFMTDTRPYVRNPAPWFYLESDFKTQLEKAENRDGNLPVIVRQKTLTIGEGSSWPEKGAGFDYRELPRNLGRNAILGEFMQKHAYRKIWENEVFEIHRADQAPASNAAIIK